jgi:hypothetical protein
VFQAGLSGGDTLQVQQGQPSNHPRFVPGGPPGGPGAAGLSLGSASVKPRPVSHVYQGKQGRATCIMQHPVGPYVAGGVQLS